MRSIKFPQMFSTTETKVWKASEHIEATTQNCITLLHSEQGEMFGDPYWGMLFKHYLFDQNNVALQNALIDMIFTRLVLFLPQLKILRSDINILTTEDKGKIYLQFRAFDQIDQTIDTYQLFLFNNNY